jgi:hypothetical protein
MTRGERLLGHPPRLQEAGEVGPLAQPGDTQFDGAGTGLPDAVAVAVALGKPLGVLLPIGGPGLTLDLQLHQPLGREADHLPQEVAVLAILNKRAKGDHVFGHRWLPNQVGVATRPLPANRR